MTRHKNYPIFWEEQTYAIILQLSTVVAKIFDREITEKLLWRDIKQHSMKYQSDKINIILKTRFEQSLNDGFQVGSTLFGYRELLQTQRVFLINLEFSQNFLQVA